MSDRFQAGDDARIARVMDELLAARNPGSTICPSEVARALAHDDDAHWRDRMDAVRRVAARRAAAGEVVVMQRGEIVDLERVRGPIRIGRPSDD